MQDFVGKVAVVTGTANPRGIGMAIVRRLADSGCKLVLADLDGTGAEQRAAELRADGSDAIAVATDMSDHASVTALADAVYDRHGAAHVVVLNHVAPTGGPGHGYSIRIRRHGSCTSASTCSDSFMASRRSFPG